MDRKINYKINKKECRARHQCLKFLYRVWMYLIYIINCTYFRNIRRQSRRLRERRARECQKKGEYTILCTACRTQSTRRVATVTFWRTFHDDGKICPAWCVVGRGGGVAWPPLFTLSTVHRKKSFSIFPSPAGMSLTKLSLGGNYDVIYKLFLPRKSLVSDISTEDGNIEKLFLRCTITSNGVVYRMRKLRGQIQSTYFSCTPICTLWWQR
jgi:hypothetical protein